MKKIVFSKFSLLLMLVVVVHMLLTIKALTANSKHGNADGLNYTSPQAMLSEQTAGESSRIATLFNIAPYVKPDASTDSAAQEQKAKAVKLKVLAITRRSEAFQAVLALEQDSKSTVQSVVVGDTVASFQVTAISKFELTLSDENGETQLLELFKSAVHTMPTEQNKDN